MKFFHFSGVFVEREDRFDRARRHAGAAVDAFVGVDVRHLGRPNSGSSLRGWMQSTGHTSTQAVSFVPMQGSVMMYAKRSSRSDRCGPDAH